jgi:uncharacterized membrane protein
MTMRLQEIHPALVHFPITMLPVTLATDAVGRFTGNHTLLDAARAGIALTAGSAAVAAAAGLLAQESARFDDASRDMLVTHRNLNLALIGLTGWMAARRARRVEPSLRYLAAGLAGIGVMVYSAYLGGRMVYEHGVGVSAAGMLREAEAPHLLPETAGEVASISATHLVRGARDVVGSLARGELVPTLVRHRSA